MPTALMESDYSSASSSEQTIPVPSSSSISTSSNLSTEKKVGVENVFLIFKGEAQTEDENEDEYIKNIEFSGLGEGYRIPVLSFKYINLDSLKVCLNYPDDYSGLILTSPRAVQSIKTALNEEIEVIENWNRKNIFCVGDKTAVTASKELNLNSIISTTGGSKELANYIVKMFKDSIKTLGKPLLMPCSTIARDTLPLILEENEIELKTLQSYITSPSVDIANRVEILTKKHNFQSKNLFVVFFSPSGVHAVVPFLEKLNVNDEQIKFISLGPTTKQSLENFGFNVWCSLEKPSLQCFIDSVLNKLLKH